MVILAFLKKLKKRLQKSLRWKRRWMNLTIFWLLVSVSSAAYVWHYSSRTTLTLQPEEQAQMVIGHGHSQPEKEVMEMISQIKAQRETFTQKIYVCGEELQPIGLMSAAEILDYHRSSPEATVSMDANGRVYFKETIEDLSPRCKENAYFGMDSSGNLSLFEGVPGVGGGSVIQTFFQLNIEHLKSSLPNSAIKELYRGIQVRDLSEYNSVLSTFSDYAVDVPGQALKISPAP
ncbi:forespore regulator of the sigma-K checkpoint [Paenibacillus sp. 1_12]|uniref:BofC C-terminal domain-containing protein n=1 Tax=Paenibacillus sp. 1_12 TaxID=1566278 RepID=UPI0008E49140|nr:BofC C-terminal domain-containing protein [Paenibacillus sp. 1_12]SFK69407.1 forespore regulator of the sigma-K checkpoint [Paenibacillus sp. 1_12]